MKLNSIKTILAIAFLMLNAAALNAQNNADKIEMADVMRENGKINVVVAVLLIIFAGIIFYLVSIDRKLSRIEKKNRN
jgi:CcmD family protein